MTPAEPAASRRELALCAFGMLLLAALLWTLREMLNPPLVLAVFVAVLWPVRRWPGVGVLLAGMVLLTLGWLLALYGGFLGPFILALGLAYLMAPVVERLARRRVPRGLAIVLVAVVPLSLLVVIILVAGPQLWDQVLALGGKIPRVADTVVTWLQGVRDQVVRLPFLSEAQRTRLGTLDSQSLADFLQGHTDQIVASIADWSLAALQKAGTLVGLLGYLVISPVIAFYLVSDWAALLQAMEALVPPAQRPSLLGFIQEYDHALGRWLRGQCIEAAIVATLTTVGLMVLGIPSALLLGLIAGAFNLIPFIGFVLSLMPALLVALAMDDPGSALIRVLIVFGIVNFIDANVTGPRFVGGSVGLHPVASMLAMAVGGTLLGFIGFLLAIPLAVFAKMVLQRVVASYKASGMYGAPAA